MPNQFLVDFHALQKNGNGIMAKYAKLHHKSVFSNQYRLLRVRCVRAFESKNVTEEAF